MHVHILSHGEEAYRVRQISLLLTACRWGPARVLISPDGTFRAAVAGCNEALMYIIAPLMREAPCLWGTFRWILATPESLLAGAGGTIAERQRDEQLP